VIQLLLDMVLRDGQSTTSYGSTVIGCTLPVEL
jgi:hypothetical protein